MKSGGLPDILPTVATLFRVSLKVVAICYTCVEMCIMQLRYKYHTENISIREDLLRKKVVSFQALLELAKKSHPFNKNGIL